MRMAMTRRVALMSLAGMGAAACATRGPLARAIPAGEDRAPDEVIPLWPQGVPGGVPAGLNETIVFRDNPFNLLDRAAQNVTAPSLSVFRPAASDGSAILIIPGGGYRRVVIDKEGFEGARHFSALGATVYVLRYRLPHQGWAAGRDAPLHDAQRAMRIIRSRAGTDGIDPARVMVMGFSAGGHLAGLLAMRFDAPSRVGQDDADGLSARPDAAALIYPVVTMTRPFAHEGSRLNLVGEAPDARLEAGYSLESIVRPDMPPVFLMHAADDEAVPVQNALLLDGALRQAGRPVALHLFETGGHGFGMRGIERSPLAAWPGLVMDWSREKGIFASEEAR